MELIVVTGIVGAMMSLAVPSYQGYVAKARQGEGKAALTRIFASEQSFYQEWGNYTLCLTQAGFIPETKRFYTVGFINGGADPTTVFSPPNVPCQINFGAGSNSTFTRTQMINDSASSHLTSRPFDAWTSSGIRAAGFEAVAFGSVSESQQLDVWSITEARAIKNLGSGL